VKTIEGYWRRIHEKTGSNSDAQVVAKFIRRTLVSTAAGPALDEEPLMAAGGLR
jgi:hypothetical protein